MFYLTGNGGGEGIQASSRVAMSIILTVCFFAVGISGIVAVLLWICSASSCLKRPEFVGWLGCWRSFAVSAVSAAGACKRKFLRSDPRHYDQYNPVTAPGIELGESKYGNDGAKRDHHDGASGLGTLPCDATTTQGANGSRWQTPVISWLGTRGHVSGFCSSCLRRTKSYYLRCFPQRNDSDGAIAVQREQKEQKEQRETGT